MEFPEPTDESRRLCERIAAETGGVCLLGFSRGKDSIAAWLHLRRYFKTIVPFHVSSIPGLGFVDRSLDYYENFFQTKIHRIASGEVLGFIGAMLFQPPGCDEEIADLDPWPYDNADVVRYLRVKLKMPGAWCAWGINASDSLDRRVYVTQYKGRLPRKRSFYPNWDWKRDRIMAWIKAAGVKLPGDYLLSNRTVASVPLWRCLYRMERVFPEDFRRVEAVFPLIRAELAKNIFRKRQLGIRDEDTMTPEEWRAEAAAKAGKKASARPRAKRGKKEAEKAEASA